MLRKITPEEVYQGGGFYAPDNPSCACMIGHVRRQLPHDLVNALELLHEVVQEKYPKHDAAFSLILMNDYHLTKGQVAEVFNEFVDRFYENPAHHY